MFKSLLLYIKAILLPHPHLLNTPFHDPQTVRDAMETGHEEPEAPAEGNWDEIEDSIAKKGDRVRLIVCPCVAERHSGSRTCGSPRGILIFL